MWSSFHGRFSDNPRALWERLCDRPGLEHVWLLDPAHATAFPSDVDTVEIDGPDARPTLESADLVVASTHIEVEWTKSPGTRYLQTWHGTPLKRIHHDALIVPDGRLALLDRDVARWDVLLSPNAASTPRLRKAFAFDGPVWETGYPRNDLLVSPGAPAARAAVRRELGLGEETRVVLYAPTWRDDERYSERRDVPLGLDVASFASRLDDGREHVVLTRLHAMMTGRSTPPAALGVLDVSWHRDVRELLLAADVLVTDYSSLMFDFALTGRPIVLHAYDLERYRDHTRGFYFDLLSDAPGPVTRTEDELVEAVLSSGTPGPSYDAFRATYGHLEDGRAADRVLERIRLA